MASLVEGGAFSQRFRPCPHVWRGATLLQSRHPARIAHVAVLRRLGLIRTVCDTPALIAGVRATVPASGDGLLAPYLAGTCARRGVQLLFRAPMSKMLASKPSPTTDSLGRVTACRLPPHPTRLCCRLGIGSPTLLEGGASASNWVTGALSQPPGTDRPEHEQRPGRYQSANDNGS